MEYCELMDLLNEHVDGRLTESRRDKLSDILISSSGARKIYWDFFHQQSLMRDILSDEKVLMDLEKMEQRNVVTLLEQELFGQQNIQVFESIKRVPSRKPRRMTSRRNKQRQSDSHLFFMAACAMLMVGVVFVIVLSNNNFNQQSSGNQSQMVAQTDSMNSRIVENLTTPPKPVQKKVPIEKKQQVPLSRMSQVEVVADMTVKPVAAERVEVELPVVTEEKDPDRVSDQENKVKEPFGEIKNAQVVADIPQAGTSEKPPQKKQAQGFLKEIGSIHIVSAGVKIIRNGKQLKLSGKYVGVKENDIIVSNSFGYGELGFDDDATFIQIQPNSRIMLPKSDEGKQVEVDEGLIIASVDKQPVDKPMMFFTQNATVKVLGTKFTLASMNERQSFLKMEEGKVESWMKYSRKVQVKAGYQLELTSGEKLRPTRTRVLRNGLDTYRVSRNLISAYVFNKKFFRNGKLYDVSRVNPKENLHMTMGKDLIWGEDGGIQFVGDYRLKTLEPAKKLRVAMEQSNELTMELWIKPDEQEDGISYNHMYRLFHFSEPGVGKNLAIGFSRNQIETHIRTNKTNEFGYYESNAITEKICNYNRNPNPIHHMMHIMITRDKRGLAKYYINGKKVHESMMPGIIKGWEKKYHLVVGYTKRPNGCFKGQYNLMAFYNRALSEEEVIRNYLSGAP